MNRAGLRAESVPLVVDLDRTLIRTDLLLESALRLIKQKPWLTLMMPLWLLKGRAYLKRKIFQRVRVDVALLPVNEEFLVWLKEEKSHGRRIILATASDYQQARAVVERFGLFDTVLGSDGRRNLKGRNKLQTLIEVCGETFDYAGDSLADLVIWRSSRQAILVNASRGVERSARRAGNVSQVFPPPFTGFRDALRAMDFPQWIKNLLLFVPAFIGGAIDDVSVFSNATLAFFSFGFAASAGSIFDDLLHLEEDRNHTIQRHRPLASGRMFIGTGIVLALASLAAGAALASLLPRAFLPALLTFFVVTSLYSLFAKRLPVLGWLTSALLYALRILAGSLATGIVLSPWALALVFFLLLGLVFATPMKIKD
jgi:phosphoserine phosphatase